MAAVKGLLIPLSVAYDARGLNKATTELGAFEGVVNKLQKRLVGVFAVDKVLAFGKATVDAFAADQKAAAEFGMTLANLGLANAITQSTEFITKLSEIYGITKDQLEPAFATLARATRSATESQSLLQTALDISAGTGKDLATVTLALSKAYGGNNAALSRLGAGLTKAQLAHNTFAQNVKILNSVFKGDAKAAADTFQGSIDRLKNTAHDASVEIGGSLVNAFTALAGTGSNSFNWVKTLGDDISKAVYWATKLAISIKDVLNPAQWVKGPSAILNQLTKDQANLEVQFNKGLVPYREGLGLTRQDAIAKANILKSANQNLAVQKQITAQANAQVLAAKAKAVLDAAGRVTDLQQIEITAALMQTRDQQTIDRLNLQKALLDQNSTAAGDLAQKVLAANLAALQSTAIDPFGNWTTGALAAINSIKDLQAQLAKLGSATVSAPSIVSTNTAAAVTAADIINGTGYVSSTGVSSNDPNAGTFAQYYQGTSGGLYGSTPVNVVVSVDKSGNLIANVQNGLNQATANGSPNNINRVTYDFNN